ncbi:hypothetical protein ETH_00043425 [Eimeria tenella]|uniref:Uncharacterized protein n=1 Tax=Eimeria tenella TaxID=5802 RepID=U6KV30_EIMTE|nr:hypothetical protein ETH_00043425 [Eimeria tenella]CDJ40219.1 hypothetical protein ETH_00043425 [Eimeria tenella]|eukprot:XP_013230972.1 hypothetical protein ETH_00043425 [Eimeria tenella]
MYTAGLVAALQQQTCCVFNSSIKSISPFGVFPHARRSSSSSSSKACSTSSSSACSSSSPPTPLLLLLLLLLRGRHCPEARSKLEAAVDAVLQQYPQLQKCFGLELFDLRIAADWDKGTAVRWILEAVGIDPYSPAAPQQRELLQQGNQQQQQQQQNCTTRTPKSRCCSIEPRTSPPAA